MSKNLRVHKLMTDLVSSPDATDHYEVPKNWRLITQEELALSKFNDELPDFIERREFKWSNDSPPYDTKRIRALLYWYGDKTGIAFHKEWIWNPIQKEGQWQMLYFAFGCKHQFKELSLDECIARGLPHYGRCWHVHECQICQHTNSYDSSD